MNILTRNVPDEIATRLDAIAKAQGVSRQDLVVNLLTQAANDYDPGIVLGYFQVHGGEVYENDCGDCGQSLESGVFVGLTAAFKMFGPLCKVCASVSD